MITQIFRIQAPALFRDFSWQPDLQDFGRYNLIYGWNGTGKTSLAKLLQQIETEREAPHTSFTLRVGTDLVRSTNREALSRLPIRVFTKDFVEENVFNPQGMPGIVFIGKENISEQEDLERLAKRLQTAQASYGRATSDESAAIRASDKHLQDTAKSIKDRLLGNKKFQHYQRNKYELRSSELAEIPVSELLRTDEQLQKLDQERNQLAQPDIPVPDIGLPSLASIEGDAEKVLSRSITKHALDSLDEDTVLRDWVGTGLGLHRSDQSQFCRFCGNKLSEERLQALEGFFSQGLKELTADIDSQLRQISAYQQRVNTVNLPADGAFYSDLVEACRSSSAALRRGLKSYSERLSEIQQRLEEKRKDPFSTLELPPQDTVIELEPLTHALSTVIADHNQKTSDLESIAETACQQIEQHCIAEAREDLSTLSANVESCKKQCSECMDEIQELEEEIRKINQRVDPHSMSAKEMTRDLRKYLGRDELNFELAGKGYRISRTDKSAAIGLSEGERTAIALLYFLQSLRDQAFPLEDGIVVLDDPVSSLDSNSLFNAFSFIRAKTAEAAQLFVLTHNFVFFRLVRRWFLRHENSCALYSLKASLGADGIRKANLQPLDDLLRHFESEYHYLFYVVHRATHANELGEVERYHLPNTARRLLEAFISFYRPSRKTNFENAVEELCHDDPVRAGRIVRFTHTFSHNEDFESSADQDMSHLSEAQAVMVYVMALIESVSQSHYTEMERLLRDSKQSERDRARTLRRRNGRT